ncbi:hypothetical protein MtrunA17_Chr3g0095491 [Medicago truncatula]|uniref:Uncharacterized protein n=1 Tax=Medicago truncatula TaxID=3880 RepID=A0A396IQZ5_MEDTR|nr:hypothetical protein MtrunA17_Chr3g0095491 [Medicago truncatula]
MSSNHQELTFMKPAQISNQEEPTKPHRRDKTHSTRFERTTPRTPKSKKELHELRASRIEQDRARESKILKRDRVGTLLNGEKQVKTERIK